MLQQSDKWRAWMSDTTTVFQGENYRTERGGGTEDSCKGQTRSLHCRVMETQVQWERNNLVRNLKQLNLADCLSVCVCFGVQTYPLCPSWCTVWPAEVQQSRWKQIALLKSPREQQQRAQRLTENSPMAPHFLQSLDRINRQKALWLHRTAFKKGLNQDTE